MPSRDAVALVLDEEETVSRVLVVCRNQPVHMDEAEPGGGPHGLFPVTQKADGSQKGSGYRVAGVLTSRSTA